MKVSYHNREIQLKPELHSLTQSRRQHSGLASYEALATKNALLPHPFFFHLALGKMLNIVKHCYSLKVILFLYILYKFTPGQACLFHLLLVKCNPVLPAALGLVGLFRSTLTISLHCLIGNLVQERLLGVHPEKKSALQSQ